MNLYDKNSKRYLKIDNLFRELIMNNVSGYNELSESEKELFDNTYKKHLSSLNEKERVSYFETNLCKVDNNVELVKVHFKNGDRFIYIDDYHWIKLSK